MNYDVEYWKNYHATIKLMPQSSFAEFCLLYMNAGDKVLDVCCGNGRDADFFHTRKMNVTAFDIADLDKPYEYSKRDLNDKDLVYSGFNHVYCRFVLHAIPENLEDYILLVSHNALLMRGNLYIEVRSNEGVDDGHHYRRLIDYDEIERKLNNIGFEIIYDDEDTGLSVDYDDPVLLRIVAKKTKEIKRSGNNPKYLDRDNATHLLLSVKKALNNIPFYLAFGTLLGAYRENNFIEHDVDVDIVLDAEYYNDVHLLLLHGYFALYDLRVFRLDKNIISFAYKGDYIDLYFLKKCGAYHVLEKSYEIESYQIDNEPTKINFIGEEFNTFNNIEDYLVKLYGKEWNTPIKYN